MMIVLPTKHIDMTRYTGRKRPAAQRVVHHLRVQCPHHRAPEAKFPHEKRPRTDVHHGATERLVQRRVRIPVPRDAHARAQGFFEAHAQRDQRVLGGVVVVDGEVALASDQQRPACVLGPGVQHVVQEADPRPDPDVLGAIQLAGMVAAVLLRDGGFVFEDCTFGWEGGEPAAVEGEGDLDVRFVGFAFLGGCSRWWSSSSSRRRHEGGEGRWGEFDGLVGWDS